MKVNFRRSPLIALQAVFIVIGVSSAGLGLAAESMPVSWVDLVGVSDSDTTVTKTAAAGWGNGGAASSQRISGNGAVEFQFKDIANNTLMCGLASENTDASYASIDYALYLGWGQVRIYEKGRYRASFGPYALTDTFKVERLGTVVSYKKNDLTLYTSTVPSIGTLLVDVAIYNTNGAVANATVSGASTSKKIALSALVKYSNPATDTANLNVKRLTPSQIAAVKSSLAMLKGKKFMVFQGEVLLLAGVDIRITNINDRIIMHVSGRRGVSRSGGSIVLAELNSIRRTTVADPQGPWYDYLYSFLESRAKDDPGALFGEDARVLDEISAYLNSRFADIGGFTPNFIIGGEGNVVFVTPKAGNRLQGLDRITSFSFENDPMQYDPQSMFHTMQSLRGYIRDDDTDFFFVVDETIIEPMSAYDINAIVAPNQAEVAYAPATGPCQLPPYPTCYDWQSNSVIPCSDNGSIRGRMIDYVEGLKDWWSKKPIFGSMTLFYADIKKLEKLNYRVTRIHDKDYDKDGVEFLKALIATPGQVLTLAFHGTGYLKDKKTGLPLEPDGFIYPIGCIPNTIEAKGALLSQLEDLYPCYLKERPVEVVQDPRYGGWSGNVFFTAGRGCGRGKLGWGIRLNDTRIQAKAIEAGYPCHGELGALRNAFVTYLNPPQLKSAGRARFDMKLFISYLLGLGPGTVDFRSYYDYYPPHLQLKHNVNVKNITDLGGPAQLNDNECSKGCDVSMPFVCTKNVQGTGGVARTVNVPCHLRPNGPRDAHLFPHITGFSFESRGGEEVEFSDQLATLPVLDFKVKGKNAIASGPTPFSEHKFTFSLIPEVEIVNKRTYDAFLQSHNSRHIPTSMFTVSGATAKANGIPMVGNPLAKHTSEDNNYKQPFFPYNEYFWNYNARAFGGDFRSFRANLPYKLYPYVTNVCVDPVQGEGILFTVGVQDAAPPQSMVEAESLVDIDCSECGSLVFTDNGRPMLTDGRVLTFTLDRYKGGFQLYPKDIPEDWKGSKIKITVKGGSGGFRSPWNQFPLLGNTRSPSKWLSDMNGNGTADWQEGNSEQFPQKEGEFEVWIPCVPKENQASSALTFITGDAS